MWVNVDEHQSNEASVPGAAAACYVMLNLDTHSNNKLMHTDSSC
jgi:hypothetical protein